MSFLRSRLESVIEGVPLILVGSGLQQFSALLQLGGSALGAILVLPETFKAPEPDAPFPILHLQAPTECYSDLAAWGLAASLALDAGVTAFLAQIDPEGTATVVSPYGIPYERLGGRRVWASDARLCRALETKRARGAVLAGELPWVAAEPAPRRASHLWWRSVRARLGSDNLVIQRTGSNAGGTGTYVCRTFEQAANAIASLDGIAGRVTPFIEGTPCNVMAFVTARGQVMVLPVSRQLSFTDSEGRPIYAGNVLGESWDAKELAGISREAQVAGRLLARTGYVGTFGLDFIRSEDGGRVYHDLNPRVNGVVSSLNLCAGPVMGALLSGPAWDFEDLVKAQGEIAAAAQEHPMARWRLTGVFGHAETETLPPDGNYRIDIQHPELTWIGPEMGPELVVGERAVVQANLFPGYPLESNRRVILGNLWCSLDALDALSSRFGNSVVETLIEALARPAVPAILGAGE
jgi:hypothetical protein